MTDPPAHSDYRGARVASHRAARLRWAILAICLFLVAIALAVARLPVETFLAAGFGGCAAFWANVKHQAVQVAKTRPAPRPYRGGFLNQDSGQKAPANG